MENINCPLVLTHTETFALLQILDARSFPGFGDPFTGWLMEEIGTALAPVVLSLVERGYVVAQDETPTVEPSIANLLKTAIETKHAVMASLWGPDSSALWLYFGEESIVQNEVTSEGHHLTPLSGKEEALGRLAEYANWHSKPAASGQPCLVPLFLLFPQDQSTLEADAETWQVRLSQSGLSDKIATPLATALAAPVSRGDIAVMNRLEMVPQVEAFAFLEDSNGLWMFEPQGDTPDADVEVRPCSAKNMLKRSFQFC